MAKSDLFHDTTSTVPRSDPRIVRIELNKEDIGARPSHISNLHPKNSYGIQHVKAGA